MKTPNIGVVIMFVNHVVLSLVGVISHIVLYCNIYF